jgi:hypothetical protein
MLRILDKDGNDLQRNSMTFTQSANPQYISIELRIKNESDKTILNPGVFLIPSSLDGSIFSFSNKTPESMLQKILLDESIEITGDTVPNDSFFNLNNGSREDNKIVITDSLQASEYVNIHLICNKSQFDAAEFYYIGLEVK